MHRCRPELNARVLWTSRETLPSINQQNKTEPQDSCTGGENLDHAALACLLATGLAKPIDLKGVAGGHVAVLAPDLLLHAVDFRREKFHRTAAFRADHVVVAAPVVL